MVIRVYGFFLMMKKLIFECDYNCRLYFVWVIYIWSLYVYKWIIVKKVLRWEWFKGKCYLCDFIFWCIFGLIVGFIKFSLMIVWINFVELFNVCLNV